MKNIKDERIYKLNNQIRSEAFNIVLVIISLSIVLKSTVFRLGLESIITEVIIYFVSLAYIVYRNYSKGSLLLEVKDSPKKLFLFVILSSLICSILMSAIIYFNDSYYNSINLDFTLLVVILISIMSLSGLIITFIIYNSDKQSIKKLNRENDQD